MRIKVNNFQTRSKWNKFPKSTIIITCVLMVGIIGTVGVQLRKGEKETNIITVQNLKENKTETILNWDISEKQDGSITAKLNEDGKLTITGIGNMKDWKIESNTPWFNNKEEIRKVVIEKGITNIGKNSFSSCSNLTDISIPEGITEIKADAFNLCSSLTKVILPESLTTVGDKTFAGCKSLSSITIPKGITKIANDMFYGCENLETIKLPEGLTTIGNWSFYRCLKLTKIVLPKELTSIGDSTFSECKNLKIYCQTGSTAETYAKEKSISYEIDEQGPNIKFEVSGSNGRKVTLTDNQSGIKENSLKYQWKRSNTTPEESSFSQNFTNGEILIKEDDVGRLYLWILAKDNLGNMTMQSEEVMTVDEITAQVSYNTTNWTNQNVTVTITADKNLKSLTGWTLSSDSKKLSKIYTENKTEMVTIQATDGTSVTKQIKIANIDKIAPEISFKINATDVDVQLTDNQSGINKQASYYYEWSRSIYPPENFSAKFEEGKAIGKPNTELQQTGRWYLWIVAVDNAGNKTVQKQQEIIGQESFAAQVKYSHTDWTNEHVKVTITTDIEVREVQGWTLSSDKKELSKMYAQNTTEEIELQASNAETRVSREIKINNIDKIAPSISFETNGNTTAQEKIGTKVTVTDTDSEVQTNALKYQWSQSTSKPTETSFTTSFTNGQEISKTEGQGTWYLWILAKDKAGNTKIESSKSFILKTTDNEDPNGNSDKNQNGNNNGQDTSGGQYGKDTTQKVSGKLPAAGMNELLAIAIVTIAITGGVFYYKYKKTM